MAKKKSMALEFTDDSFSLTSMIDVVFLLLIYFMYLPIQQEADMSVQLPIQTPPTENVTLPSEQKVKIQPNGIILLNDSQVATRNDVEKAVPLTLLSSTLKRLRLSAEAAGVQMIVTIIPDGDSPHQASMSVLDACSRAGVKQVSFSDAL